MSVPYTRVLIAAAVGTITPMLAVGQQTPTVGELVDHVQREFPRVWTRATDGPYTSDCSFEQYRVAGKDEQLSQAITFKYRRGTAGRYLNLMELTKFDQSGGKPFDSLVAVANPQYEFKLRKSYGGPSWLLFGWQLAGENKADFRPPVVYKPEIIGAFSHHLTFSALPLDKLMTSPGWKANSVQSSPDDRSLMRVHFSFSDSTHPGYKERSSGWFDLDPKAGWCIRRSDTRRVLDFQQGNQISKRSICNNEYNLIDGAIPVLTGVQCKDSDIKPDGSEANQQRRIFHFDTRYAAVPDSEFTLTAFGLPEPVGIAPERSGTPPFVWLAVAAAGVLGAAALLFRWLARRKQVAQVEA